ncbi:BACON domain-containing protein [Proteiniphilum sp. UBA5384]|uniref:BACON domain-containing protein n=1 Tax=Proteiniphilum sp. UBA5384 TaxID=1947279 RepID=UPI0025FF4F9A|nr:BACON domain-containing protein [Proteiniphilum sp. UBA5384]
MNVRNITIIIISLLSTILFFSCDDKDEFLKRNLEELYFDYTESTLEFTVRATGNWVITIPSEYPWIHADPASGTGNAEEYQKIRVTCDRNIGNVREGAIFLNGSGENNIEIKIYQKDGLFEWSVFPNGEKLSLDGILQVGSPSSASIKIPYLKATGLESFAIAATLSGKGADGLKINQSEIQVPEEGDGFALIPISGTPTQQGAIAIQLNLQNEDFGIINTITRVGNTILTKKFDEFIWGGDCIGNKAGISTINPTATMTLSDETQECAVGTNGANGSGVTSTIRNQNVPFYAEIGMTNWLGVRNYMRPGYIQLGAASATSTEYGSLITPGLDIPEGEKVDLIVTFKGATYNDPSPKKILLGLFPKGVEGIKVANISSMTQKVYVPFEIGHQKWVEFSCIIENATNQSAIAFSLPEDWVQDGAVQAGRFYIDDIVVSY